MIHKGKRVLISAVKSGSGKTTVTAAILKALKNRGLIVRSFKCGPDYIDPMFHKSITGIPSKNLDPFFQDRELMRYLYADGNKDADISVIEGVMGYYDGRSFEGAEKSTYECALNLKCPVILVVDGKGMAYSVIAVLKGMKELRADSNIRGVIINNVSEKVYLKMKAVIERETGISCLGFMPHIKECEIKSRHLGLMTPDETAGLERITDRLSGEAERNIDIDGLLALSNEAEDLEYNEDYCGKFLGQYEKNTETPLRIGIARDKAFSFIYEDNLKLLEKLGAVPVFFSPLSDKELPRDIDGLILFGGYPEVYAEELSSNESMLTSVRESLENGLPALAECGGFLYLHEFIKDPEGREFALAGFLKGARAEKTERLQNFGYKKVGIDGGCPLLKGDESVKAHEFHYYKSSIKGQAFVCNTFCGFPHFFYYSDPLLLIRFLELCGKQRENRR